MADLTLPHDHGSSESVFEMSRSIEDGECYRILAESFKQLSDPTRIKIFWLLCHCEECVMNISAVMGMSSPAVSHHLRGLKAAGLVSSERKGREVYYSVPDSAKCRAFHQMVEDMLAVTCPSASLCGPETRVRDCG